MSADLDERERLLAHLELARGRFSLLMARYADEREAWRMWDGARAELGQRGLTIALVDLEGAEPGADLLGRLTRLAEGVDALFVVHLEDLMITPEAQLRRTRALATLNFNRDLLRERLGLPVVLWLSRGGARAFAQLAPDTFDIVRSTFEMPQAQAGARPPPQPAPQRSYRARHQYAPAAEHPRLRERAQLLESLLEDAEPEGLVAGDLCASLASVALALGEEPEAERWLERAADTYTSAGSLGAAASAHRQRAELLAARGEPARARELLARARELIASRWREGPLGTRPDILALEIELDAIEHRGAEEQAPDHELLPRWRSGDRRAGDALLRRYFAQVRRYVLSRVPPDMVEELVQETFMVALQHGAKGQIDSFRSLLFGIATRLVRAHYRRRGPAPVDPLEVDQYVDLGQRSAEEVVLERQRWSAFLRAMEQLPLAQANLLELRYVHGLTNSELAHALGLPRAAIPRRLSRAKQGLRALVEQSLPTADDLDLDAELARLRRASEEAG